MPASDHDPTQARLDQAASLIRARRFAEARQLLQGLKHPQAEAWLRRLDEAAGASSSPRCPLCASSDFTWAKVRIPVASSTGVLAADDLQLAGRPVYARICAACSNVQLFLSLPAGARMT
jgi:hypothetical protein